MSIGRREFLKSSAAMAAISAAGGFSCIKIGLAHRSRCLPSTDLRYAYL